MSCHYRGLGNGSEDLSHVVPIWTLWVLYNLHLQEIVPGCEIFDHYMLLNCCLAEGAGKIITPFTALSTCTCRWQWRQGLQLQLIAVKSAKGIVLQEFIHFPIQFYKYLQLFVSAKYGATATHFTKVELDSEASPRNYINIVFEVG